MFHFFCIHLLSFSNWLIGLIDWPIVHFWFTVYLNMNLIVFRVCEGGLSQVSLPAWNSAGTLQVSVLLCMQMSTLFTFTGLICSFEEVALVKPWAYCRTPGILPQPTDRYLTSLDWPRLGLPRDSEVLARFMSWHYRTWERARSLELELWKAWCVVHSTACFGA